MARAVSDRTLFVGPDNQGLPFLPWSPKSFGQLVLLPVLLVLLAGNALLIDCPLAQWCVEGRCPGFFRDLFDLTETFGHGLGVLLILIAWLSLDRSRHWALPRVAAMSWGAGLTADVIKLIVGRVRPHHFDFQGNVAETFIGWLPLLGRGSGGQSFPSAHTATAFGLAVALGWLYPRGRRLFLGLAVLVACQRMASGAHYLSDTLVGAAVGLLTAAVCLRTRSVGGAFDRLENRLRIRRKIPIIGRQAVPTRQSGRGDAVPITVEPPSRAA